MYPELVALIGTTVPDYRGIFLRGHGSQVSTHYGTVTHASASLGELQGDAIRNMGRLGVMPSDGKAVGGLVRSPHEILGIVALLAMALERLGDLMPLV